MNSIKHWGPAVIAGFLGSVFALMLWRGPTPAYASQDQVTMRQLRLTDNNGRLYAEMKHEAGEASSLAFLDPNGSPLLKMGIDQKGLPYIRLYGGAYLPKPKLDIVLKGTNESARLIFKDSQGHDRLEMGLDGKSEDPFFLTRDAVNTQQMLFGKPVNE